MLDINKLSKVKHSGNNIIAQCPACAEAGHDKKGNHLIIFPNEAFGCVVNPGDQGHSHKQRIFAIAGIKEIRSTKNEKGPASKKDASLMKIKPAERPKPLIINKNVLGRLGQLNETYAQKEIATSKDPSSHNSLVVYVPNVPELHQKGFSEKLGLHFVFQDDCMHFEDGVIYTSKEIKEMENLKDIDNESLKKIHEIKRMFNGTVNKVTEK